ncbi:hypothetical protein EX30DRAFT_363360 [Ascodesmis nigricans]|uniref:Uncharacterized protein n=1 Tax=Ascodesmis nigricans TaxID=341454 RepID=A0A4S2MZQ5_9PEZI|nr:hypothetical protein EX30DRAFT_363360 [Ascodesmis nigricans]
MMDEDSSDGESEIWVQPPSTPDVPRSEPIPIPPPNPDQPQHQDDFPHELPFNVLQELLVYEAIQHARAREAAMNPRPAYQPLPLEEELPFPRQCLPRPLRPVAAADVSLLAEYESSFQVHWHRTLPVDPDFSGQLSPEAPTSPPPHRDLVETLQLVRQHPAHSRGLHSILCKPNTEQSSPGKKVQFSSPDISAPPKDS